MASKRDQPNSLVVAVFAILGALGVVAVLAAALLLSDIPALKEREALLEALPAVETSAPGDHAILDGHVAPSVQPMRAEFVAYRREKKARSGWEAVDQGRQPLAVEAGTATFAIGNSDYRFEDLLSNWTDSSRHDEDPTWTRGAIRIEGLVSKGPVMAIGRLVPRDGESVFQAETVVGLSRAEYAKRLAAATDSSWSGAIAALIVGLVLLTIGGFGLKRAVS